MITVIIAGGSGTRLWPLSTPNYPKHLLTLNGSSKSLLQFTYERAQKIGNEVYVLTEASHAEHVKEQLPKLKDDHFIIEPARRGTASCIIAGMVYVSKKIDHDEPIAFVAADHYVRDINGFQHSFKVAEDTSRKEGRIVLVGIEPDKPATGFGYIQKGKVFNEKNFVFNVHSFTEKPDFETAKKYLKSGNYLWNASYHVGSINTFLSEMKKNAPQLYDNYQKLHDAKPNDYVKTYLEFENDSIDYALIEKVKDLLVVPASFDWMDLGSFGDMHKAVGGDEQGNHLFGDIETEGVENSFVQNHEEKPVAVIGLDNIVVINTKHGILVARKDLAQKVGEVSKRINGKK